MSERRSTELSRRGFLKTTTAGAMGASLGALSTTVWAESTTPQSQPAGKKPALPHGKLGRTNHPVTLVSLGAILLRGSVGTRVLRLAIDRGVNLVHTSASYGGGASVAACGELFKTSKAYRDKIFLCLKSFTPEREAEIDDMFTKLHIDHADAVLTELHAADPRRIDAIRKQQDSLKKKGKVKHTGFVCHGDMNGVLELIVEKHAKDFDVALLATRMVPDLTVGGKTSDEQGQRFLKSLQAMRKAGIGILSMKSGARKAAVRGADAFLPHVKAYLQAGADAILTSMDTLEQVEMATKLDLSSPHLSPEEHRAAAAFQNEMAGACRMCAACAKACPRGLPVNDLMRFRMYHAEYGWHAHARAEYAACGIDFRAAVADCGNCTACADACPVKLASRAMIDRVAGMLA